MKNLFVYCLALCSFFQFAYADKYEPDRQQMRLILEHIIKGVNDKDLKTFIEDVHPNAVVTFYDGHVAVGKDAVSKYFNRMLKVENSVLKDISIDGAVDRPANIFDNNMSTAWGWVDNKLYLSTGGVLDVNGRWSASMIKEKGRWYVSSIHFSTNIFDNVLLNQAKDKLIWAALLSLAVGLLVGGLVGRNLLARKR